MTTEKPTVYDKCPHGNILGKCVVCDLEADKAVLVEALKDILKHNAEITPKGTVWKIATEALRKVGEQ